MKNTTIRYAVLAALLATAPLAAAQSSDAGQSFTVKADSGGFSFGTADGANVIKLRPLVHFDGRFFQDDAAPDGSDTWLLRRVRPTIEGTFANRFDFRITSDFAGGRTVLQDAYVAARFSDAARVQVGKFKAPVGLERLQSADDMRFIERSLVTGLVPNRDLGVQLSGDLAGRRVSYAIGLFNGVPDGGSSDSSSDSDADNDKDIAARVFVQPFGTNKDHVLAGLGFGIGGTYVDSTGTTDRPLLGSYRSGGQQTIFRWRTGANGTFADGERLRWSPQFHYYRGPFGLIGEYAQVSQDVSRATATGLRSDSVDIEAWQLTASWIVTGEANGYRRPRPSRPFTVDGGGTGAVEIAVRYNQLEIGDEAFAGGADSFADPAVSVRKAQAWGVGVNWYLNANLKWAINYEQTSFDGGAPLGGDRPDEKVILTRIAVGF